MKGSSKAS